MKFAVLAKTPLEIKDPKSGESLGQLEREKVRIRVKDVREKFAVCTTYRVFNYPGIASAGIVSFPSSGRIRRWRKPLQLSEGLTVVASSSQGIIDKQMRYKGRHSFPTRRPRGRSPARAFWLERLTVTVLLPA